MGDRKMRRRNYGKIICILTILFLLALPLNELPLHDGSSYDGPALERQNPPVAQAGTFDDYKTQDHWDEVIVKWKQGADLPEIPGTEIVVQDAEARLAKLVVEGDISVEEILAFANTYKELEYVQPNYRYKIHATPNDPGYSTQWHHKQINLPQAWDIHTGNRNIVIAVLDTGVDHTHPDLSANLVKGFNVLRPSELPVDDYGHGTQVAGILAAAGNNGQGVTGVLWNAQIMPIKVLDAAGEGDDFSIGQGIRYAVKNGAKIIVLSLGDRLYSKHMEEAVLYAENEGVLLVAATGNNGSTVNYPAAFPTVLAVGASDERNLVPAYSNFGPEVDVVAPGQGIYTTGLRGQMTYNSGTSMATPIVAGVAALVYSEHPDMQPWQVRQLIRQSAVSGNPQIWDSKLGYGVVDAYRALTIKPEINLWAPNNTWEQAKKFPMDTRIDSTLRGVNDVNWFYIDVDHRGKISLPFTSEYAGLGVTWFSYRNDSSGGRLEPIIHSPSRTLESGRYYIRVQVSDWRTMIASLQQSGVTQNQYGQHEIIYHMEQHFQIAEDRFEPNQSIFQAAKLDIFAARQLEQGLPYMLLEGTFHRDMDYDWYELDLPVAGQLTVEVINSYGRMDPVLTISKELTTDSKKYMLVDDHEHGAGEFWSGDVTAGKFYFMVADYQLKKQPVPYQVKITYIPNVDDRWEPNYNRQMAPNIAMGQDVYAYFNGMADEDWYAFVVGETSTIQMDVNALVADVIMENVVVAFNIYESTQEQPLLSRNITRQRNLSLQASFTPGVYYVQMKKGGQENAATRYIPYRLRLQSLPGNANTVLKEEKSLPTQRFVDITTDELRQAATYLYDKSIVQGFPDGTFRPNEPLTRGQLTTLVLRVLDIDVEAENAKLSSTLGQSEVEATHWAYAAMRVAVDQGILVGFADQTLRPDALVTRAELVTILCRAFDEHYRNLLASYGNRDIDSNPLLINQLYQDVPRNHWAYHDIQMNGILQYIGSKENSMFMPSQQANRSDVALAVYKILQTDLGL